MLQDKFELSFLSLFYEDMAEIADYISFTLKNPDAAEKLVEDVFSAIDDRLPTADSFEPYPSNYEFRYRYYKINVRNFMVFYVVIDDKKPKETLINSSVSAKTVV